MNREQYKTLCSEMRSRKIDGSPLWPRSMSQDDRLRIRSEMAASIAKCAVIGHVMFEACGTDCDGYGWQQEYLIPATLMHYLTEVKRLNDSADGMFSTGWSTPQIGDFDCNGCTSRTADYIVHGMAWCEPCAHEVA